MPEELRIQIEGDDSLPTLIYFPGLHGDWTLIRSFRAALINRVRLVGITYPRAFNWSLDDCAAAIEIKLSKNNITGGWLLGESFGSQIVWQFVARNPKQFAIKGIILVGGFVKHPSTLGILCAKAFCLFAPKWSVNSALNFYAALTSFRTSYDFRCRRAVLDLRAVNHRLDLLRENDFRSLVSGMKLPVYALAGFRDWIVPSFWTQMWLKHSCPGFQGGKTIWSANHNVLGTAPDMAAEIALTWINNHGAWRNSER